MAEQRVGSAARVWTSPDRPTSGNEVRPMAPPARYSAPRLVVLGDLRDLTLGGSVGRGDSGAPTRQARVGGP